MRTLAVLLTSACVFTALTSAAGVPVGNGGDGAAYRFHVAARAAIRDARAIPELGTLPFERLEEILSRVQVMVSAEPLFVGEGEMRQRVTAKNYPDSSRVLLDPTKWEEIPTSEEQEALAMHELLGLAGLESTADYHYSRHLVDRVRVRAADTTEAERILTAPLELNEAPDAELAVITYADFESPFCRLGTDRLHALLGEFGDKIHVVMRLFPMTVIHEHAESAARAGVCAAAQGKFRAMHDRLFPVWDHLGTDEYLAAARSIGGLDLERFTRCLDSPAAALRVRLELAEAEQLKFIGAPTTVFTTRHETARFGGVYPYEDYRGTVQRLLKAIELKAIELRRPE